MESLLARALESKLRYYLRSYSRDQFKLQGSTVQLTNLDLNGDVLHSLIGLPSTLRVSKAHVAVLQIRLPPLAVVSSEPTVVSISNLSIVLKEREDEGEGEGQQNGNSARLKFGSIPASPAFSKSTSYGFADKIADGMTVEVDTVTVTVETRGGASVTGRNSAIWRPPLASLTLTGLRIFTTNEHWQVVNLADTRSFFANRKSIYVFRVLEWESLSLDIIPHPDMFDDDLIISAATASAREEDGARRLFFGGERIVDNIAGKAFLTMHRDDCNNPLGLEVDLQLSEALSPSLSEPGLRALLRFSTGLFACLQRADATSIREEAPGQASRVVLSVALERLFVRLKESEYQLELLLHSLHFIACSTTEQLGAAASVSNMVRLYLGHVFLRDTRSFPPLTLLQPARFHSATDDVSFNKGDLSGDDDEADHPIPSFASDSKWPRIYPLSSSLSSTASEAMHLATSNARTQTPPPLPRPPPPMLSLFSAFSLPSPGPPSLASQLLVRCDPLQVVLHEESCLRIASLLADGLMVQPQAQPQPQAQTQTQTPSQPPSTSHSSLRYALFLFESLDLTASLPTAITQSQDSSDVAHQDGPGNCNTSSTKEEGRSDHTLVHPKSNNDGCATLDPRGPAFSGARIMLQGFSALLDPFMQFENLQLDDDPACFTMWRGQPVDASQLRLAVWADLVSVSLNSWAQPSPPTASPNPSPTPSSSVIGLQCVRVKEPRLELALLSADGHPLQHLPPPGGTVRLGLSCCHLTANSNYQQLLFVLQLAEYLVLVSQELVSSGKNGAAINIAMSPSAPTAESDTGAVVNSGQSSLTHAQMLPGASLPPLSAWQLEAPADSAVLLAVDEFRLRILESSLSPASTSASASSSLIPGSDSRASMGACHVDGFMREGEQNERRGADRALSGSMSSSSTADEEVVLSQLLGTQLRMKVSHRSLGGASAVTTTVDWEGVSMECIDSTASSLAASDSTVPTSNTGATLPAVTHASPSSAAAAPASADIVSAPVHPRRAVFWSPPSASHSSTQPRLGTLSGSGLGLKLGTPAVPAAAATVGTGARMGSGAAVPTLSSGMSGQGGCVSDRSGWHDATPTVAAPLPFLSLHLEHVLPYSLFHEGQGGTVDDDDAHSLSLQAKVAGVRMGGGWAFNEGLLRRFGLLDTQGEAGGTLLHFIDVLAGNKALRCILDLGAQAAPNLSLPMPKKVDVSVHLLDWLFALEGPAPPLTPTLPLHHIFDSRQHLHSHQHSALAAPQLAATHESLGTRSTAGSLPLPLPISKEDLCWHSSFRSVHIEASSKESRNLAVRCAAFAAVTAAASTVASSSSPSPSTSSTPAVSVAAEATAGPLRSVKVRLEGLQALKPRMLAVAVAETAYYSGSGSGSGNGGGSSKGSGAVMEAREQTGPPREEKSLTGAHVDMHAGMQDGDRFTGVTAASATAVVAQVSGTGVVQDRSVIGAQGGSEAGASILNMSTIPTLDSESGRSGLDVQLCLSAIPSSQSLSAPAASAPAPGSYKLPTRGKGIERLSTAPVTLTSDESSSSATTMASGAEDLWIVESIQAGVQEAVCVEATQQELEHLWQVCRHELAAATRITSAAMRLMLQRGSHLVPANAIMQLEQLGQLLERSGESFSSPSHQSFELLATGKSPLSSTAHMRTSHNHLPECLAGTGPPAATDPAINGAGRETCTVGASAGAVSQDVVNMGVSDRVYLSSQTQFQALSQLASLADGMREVQGRLSSLMLSSTSLANDEDGSEQGACRQHTGTEWKAANEAVTAVDMEGSGQIQRDRLTSECVGRVLEEVNAAVAGIESLRHLLFSGK